MSTLVTYIKKYRMLNEMSQDTLASLIGVRRETIVHLEAGKYNPSLKLAYDIAKVFKVPIEEIFTFKD